MSLWVKYKGLAYLALLVVILPLVAYQYAFSRTISQARKTRISRVKIEQLRKTANTHQKRNTIELNSIEMITSGLVIAELLPAIDAGKLQIESFSPCVTSDKNDIKLITGQLTVQGGFTGILNLLENIEHNLPQCKIISVEFRSAKPINRNAVKTLSCTIYIQQMTAH